MGLGVCVLLVTHLLSQVNGRTPVETYRSLKSQDRADETDAELGTCLSSPGFPDSYPNDNGTEQAMEVPAGQKILVTFIQFDIEKGGSTCPYDYVLFFDASEVQVGDKRCGDSLPQPITIESSTAKVVFISDGSVTKKGFKLCYTPTGLPKCLTSPNYPEKYPNKTNVREEFSVKEGFSIDITFEDLDVERGSANCPYDYIQFLDGKNKPKGNKICGNSKPEKFNIPSSSASVFFHSDSSEEMKGFKFCYKPGTELGTCLTSPLFPEFYPNDNSTEQSMEVPAGQKIRVTFHQLDIEPGQDSSSCPYDYVEILDASGERVGDKLCGNSLPQPITIASSSAKVVFSSDGSVTKTGFKLCYYPVSAPSQCGVENIPRTRISGGTETAPNQFPWMVRLPMGCGGSFITDKHILTAKHCVDEGDWRGRLVKISVHNQADSEDYEEVPIKDYVWPELDQWQDIAIITLQWAVDLSDNTIGTVCLPASADEDYRGKKALAMGWGWTPDTESQSKNLQKLELTVTEHQSDIWLFTKVVFRDGVPLDVCRGDSGGPLVYNQDGRWTIIGTVQGGSYCNSHSGSDGRWNKVTGHLQWIKSIIGK